PQYARKHISAQPFPAAVIGPSTKTSLTDAVVSSDGRNVFAPASTSSANDGSVAFTVTRSHGRPWTPFTVIPSSTRRSRVDDSSAMTSGRSRPRHRTKSDPIGGRGGAPDPPPRRPAAP